MFTSDHIMSEILFLHPDLLVNNDAKKFLNDIFNIFGNKTDDEIINDLPANLKRVAKRNYELKLGDQNYGVRGYILAEVLELSGNRCRDRKRKKITSEDIKNGIKGDNELSEVFSSINFTI